MLSELWKRSRFTSYFYQSVHLGRSESVPTLALSLNESRAVLYYNEDFVESLSPDECIGLLVHEMLHVINGHEHRARAGDELYFQNLAQDMVINSYMIDMKDTFFSRRGDYSWDVPSLVLPPGLPVIPDDFYSDTGRSDPSWEDLYRWLRERPKQEHRQFAGTGMDNAGGGAGDPFADSLREQLSNPLDLPEEGPGVQRFDNLEGVQFEDDRGRIIPTGVHVVRNIDDQRQLQTKMKTVVDYACRDSDCRDERAYEEINRMITGAKEADISAWRHLVRSIIDYRSQSQEWTYTYSRFNKRYFGNGIYAPGRVFTEQALITVAVDVSSSMVMKPGEIELAFGVLEELLDKYRISLVCVDEELFIPRRGDEAFVRSSDTHPYYYRPGDWRYLKTGSSGTTFFAPLFNEYMKGHREMLVVITDGYVYDLDRLRRYAPTLWVLSGERTNTFAPPFGRAVSIGG